MHRARLGWILALAVMLSLGTHPAQSSPAVTAAVTIHPAAATFAAGEAITVEVWVENVVDLYGADIRLGFDPAAFQVLDANPSLAGVQVKLRSDLLQPGFVIHREADNQAGFVWYANAQVNPALPASGSGALFEFGLLALANGTFPIEITSAQLSDKSGNPIAFTLQPASYTLLGYRSYLPLLGQGN